MRSTHTYVTLELSPQAFEEIRKKLEAARYQHAIIDQCTIDMHGLAVTREQEPQLAQYRCHKVVRAGKIAALLCGRSDGKGPGATLEFADGVATVSVGEKFMSKHDPEEGGYYVVYEDGYESFSPAKAFEEGYTRIE